MLFNLVVCKLKHLQTILESSLGCLGLGEVVGHFLVGKSLLDVFVIEVNDCVAIGERFTLNSVVEDNLFLATCVNSLKLSIVAHDLFNYFSICRSFSVVFFWKP